MLERATKGRQKGEEGATRFGIGIGIGIGLGVGGGRESDASATAGVTPLAFEGKLLRITQEQHEGLSSVYQGLDVAAYYAEADLWMQANPQKHRKNHFAFMRNWLAREVKQNQSGGPKNGRITEAQREAQIGAGPPGEHHLTPAAEKRLQERIDKERHGGARKNISATPQASADHVR